MSMTSSVERSATRRVTTGSRWRVGRLHFLFLPAILYLAVFYVLPLAALFRTSFFDPGFTLRYYVMAFTSSVYLNVLLTTLQISLLVTILCVVIAYPLAYFLTTLTERTRNLILIGVVLPYFTSVLVRSYAWLIILGREGAINGALRSLGIIDHPLALVYNLTGVIIGMTHILLPVMVLSLYGVMHNINKDMIAVSHSLGAHPVQTFFRVYLPASLPGVGAGCVLVFIFAVGYYVTPALLGGLRTTMISMLIATQVEELLNWRMAGALSMLLLSVTLALFVSLNQALGLDKILSGDASDARSAARFGNASDGLVARLWSAIVVGLEVAIMSFDAGVRHLWRRITPVSAPRGSRRPRASLSLRVIVAAILFFLLVPLALIIPISFTSTLFLSFPPKGFSLRWYQDLLDAPIWAHAFFLSLRVGLTSALFAMLLGLLASVAVVRTSFPGKTAVYLFLISPLIVPVIVIAVALYYLFAQFDLVGSFWGLVLGHTIGGIPVVLILVCAALRGADIRLEYAAMSLGASATRAFVQITLPIILPSLLAASFFAFLHSFDEVVIATFIGGLSAETLPKKLWEGVRLEIKPTLAAVSSLLILFTAIILLAVEFLRHGRRTRAVQ